MARKRIMLVGNQLRTEEDVQADKDAELAALRARVAELEAERDLLFHRLDVTTHGLKFSLDTFHPDDRARYSSVIEQNQIAMATLPASAKALAEVVEEFRTIAKQSDCEWTRREATKYLAKLDAAKGAK